MRELQETAAPIPLVVGLDYELFFSPRTGTIGRCLIDPIDHLLDRANRHNLRLTLFVDAGYLRLLKSNARTLADYRLVADHLRELYNQGHDVQLHVHPHWECSGIENDRVIPRTERYRLHDFDDHERRTIVRQYKETLEEIISDRVTAYRAGGWCVQPFGAIASALSANGIFVDSTVYAGGLSEDTGREFDFREAPTDLCYWRFSEDPNVPEQDGTFLQIPITSVKVSPSFFVVSELRRRFGGVEFSRIGDGEPLSHNGAFIFNKLIRSTQTVASIDGSKPALLPLAYANVQKLPNPILNLIGHPKALSKWGIGQFCDFLNSHETTPTTIRDLVEERLAFASSE